MIGKRLAHYEILSQLGKGGMGEVYRARDTRLGREVALKLLPDELAHDPERLARFEREAKLLASFAHPNIATLYGLENVDGRTFLVMELAEGEDLSQRLRRGAIPLNEALGLAIQIAEGIEAAHAKGIVHRDLKPANVMLGGDGRVKLLDFGLARAYQPEDASGDPAMSPTMTAAMTRQGVILGTAGYMSPEQARGKPVDKQSDVWAFGVLLFEMLTAHRLFHGETISESIGAILHREPDWSLLPANTPRQVQRALRRCLERDLATRLHDLGDARVELLEAQRNPEVGAAPSVGTRGPWLQRGLGALAGIAVGIALMFFLVPRDESVETGNYRIFDLGVRAEPGDSQRYGRHMTIAPDGHAVAYAHEGRIWVRNLDGLEPRAIEGSEEGFGPFWSPDGTQIGWFQGTKLLRAPVSGGRAVQVCAIGDRLGGGVNASWAPDGRIFFSTGTTGIQVVNAVGGAAREAIPTGEGIRDLHDPVVLPGDGGLLFVEHPGNGLASRLSLHRDGAIHALLGNEIAGDIQEPCYDPRGYILFYLAGFQSAGGLWALRFDAASGSVQGEPILIEAEGIAVDVADDGTLAYVSKDSSRPKFSIALVDREGQFKETVYGPLSSVPQGYPSRDGRRMAINLFSTDQQGSEIWLLDRDREAETRIFDSENATSHVAWSWDGRTLWISTFDRRNGKSSRWSVPADGSRAAEQHGDNPLVAISPDGRALLEFRTPGATAYDPARADSAELWWVPIDGSGDERRLVAGMGLVTILDLAPSGSYALYGVQSGERTLLALTRYPSFEGRWQVVEARPLWDAKFAPDGSAIYYVTPEGMHQVSLREGAEPILGRSERLFEFGEREIVRFEIDPRTGHFEATVRIREDGQENAPQGRGIRLVENWTARLGGL